MIESKKFPRIFTAVFLLAVCGLKRGSYFFGAEDRWIDVMFRHRGMIAADPRVAVVAIDDASIKKVGQFPWPRRQYEKLLDALYARGVRVVGMDVLFLDPSVPEDDAVLIRATRKAGDRLVHAANIDTERLDALVVRYPFKALQAASSGFGLATQPLISSDGVVREMPLVIGQDTVNTGSWADDPKRVPVLGLAVLSRYEGKPVEDYLRKHPAVVRLNIAGQRYESVGTVAQGDRRREIQREIYGVRRIPAWRVLAGELAPAERAALQGGMALVGSTTLAAFDHFPSAFTDGAPGIEVHANLIDNLLNDRYLREAPWYLPYAVIFAIGLAVLALIGLGPWEAGIATLALLLGWAGAVYAAFLRFCVLDFIAPAVAAVGVFVVLIVRETVLERRNKRDIQQMFGQYVAPEVVDLLVRDRSRLRLGGERRDMTVLFLDIVHFTTISEKMVPEALIQFLNRYLTALSDVVLRHGGVVDKYIGDCVMAFWNAPLDVPDHRQKACLAAVECLEAVERLNKEYLDPAIPEPPAVRIGINSGVMVVGNTGSTRKLSYTVLGDEVNLASRLEGANKFFGSTAMASESAYAAAKDSIEARPLGRVRVLGKSHPIRVFELLAKKGGLSAAWSGALPLYEKAVAAYENRGFKEAREGFEAVLRLLPGDRPAALYVSLCKDYLATAPPPNWDAVFNLTAK